MGGGNVLFRKLLLIAVFTIAFGVNAIAQINISGVVTEESGFGLPGVSVVVQGTTIGVLTGMDGDYTISVPNTSSVLEFSFIGYQTQTITAGNQSTINVVLSEDIQMLDEVVVIGYGVQRKSAVAGSISSVSASDIQNRAATSIVDAMAGKTAGVATISSSGAPGSSGTMLIRGFSSNNSSKPLYVVDGLRIDDISNLDPNTIESIEILKDAASAAIYGAEAGNGVVMVTTKKGDGKSRIMYEGQIVANSLTRIPKVLDAKDFVDWQIINGKYSQSEIDYTINDGLWDGKTSTSWLDEMTESGMSNRHTLSFQGSGSGINYYASMGYTNQDGIVSGNYDSFKRINATLNLNAKVLSWLEIGNNTNFFHSNTTSVSNNFFRYSYYFDPTISPTYSPASLPKTMQDLLDKGKVLLTDENGDYYGVSYLIATDPCNPYVLLNNNGNESKALSFQGNAYANITPFKGLVFTSRLAYNIGANNSWRLTKHYYGSPNDFANTAGVSRSQTETNYYQWENFANYNVSIADNHHITAMLGMSYSNQDIYDLSGSQSAIRSDVEDNPLFWDLAYAESTSDDNVSGTHNWYRKLSYYGRLNYNYKDRYTIQVTMRADAADLSLLSMKNRWGYFPAVMGAWTISNEDWFNVNKIDFLKLRASWGQNGSTSSLSNYAYASSISTIATGYSFDGKNYTVSSTISGLDNPDLKWETSEQLDFGLDARLFNNRLSFSADWFKKTTIDLILTSGITIPASAGLSAPAMNGGNVINSGLEFEAGWNDRINGFGYSINANFSTLHNEVTKIHETVTRYTSTNTAFEVGHPVWYLWAYECEGIDETDGHPIIKDRNGDGSLNNEDRYEAGSGLPDFTYGITLSADYKNFDLNIFAQGVGGNQIFRATGAYQQNTMQYFYDRTWTPEKAKTATMAPMNTQNYTQYALSDAFIFDGDYFKIQQIQLGYTLPKTVTNKLSIGNVRLYVSLEDWFLFTPYECGMDPSVNQNSSTGLGVDNGAYPNYKKTIFGINVTF